jgi:undecaprenyl phosphate-alpha-L-ara4N flippase subunit ArnE
VFGIALAPLHNNAPGTLLPAFYKIGATTPSAQQNWLIAWQTAVGICLFGCSLLAYILVLRIIPLNLAQSFLAVQFIGVTLASAVILSETISPARWIGIVMISLGILVVGITTVTQ